MLASIQAKSLVAPHHPLHTTFFPTWKPWPGCGTVSGPGIAAYLWSPLNSAVVVPEGFRPATATAPLAGILGAGLLIRARRRQLERARRLRLYQGQNWDDAWDEVKDGWADEGMQVEADSEGIFMKRAPLLIEGQVIVTDKTFRVYSPATGGIVGLAPQVSLPQIDRAVEAADRAADRWVGLGHAGRARCLAQCATLIRENLEPLAILQTNESGRPIHETRLELTVAAANFDAAGRLLNIEKEEEVSSDGTKRVMLRRTPLGVVAVIAPWNAPIVLGWKPTASALACGNTVVLKPAPQTPLTTLRIGELLHTALPPGVLNVVVGSDKYEPRPGELLTSHPMVRKVVFTGSTAIGSKVMEACSKDFKRVLLELGGNDAAIIRQDCNIPETVEGVFKGAFFNNGQTCCAIKRVYVHEAIFESFVEALAARARKARLGNGLVDGTELGPLASNVQLKHVESLVEDAKKEGGKVICGGGATAGPPGDEGTNTGLFYLPTIVTNVREGTRLVDEEQFGPVVPVMHYRDDSEAIRRANATDYGLGASVWSSDIAKANELAKQLRAGTVWVNRHCEFIRNAPFGGFGSSGIGRAGDLSMRDFAEYTELKTMVYAPLPVPSMPSSATERVVVQDQALSILSKRLASLSLSPDADLPAFENEVKEALRTFPLQPVNWKAALNSVGEAGGPPCVVLQNLPTAEKGNRDLAAQALLIGIMGLVGAHVFSYAASDAGEQELVKDLFACPSEAKGLHRPGRCSPPLDAPRRFFREEDHVAEFAATCCLQAGSEPAKVSFVDFSKLCSEISLEDLECLRRWPLSFFDGETGFRTEQVVVVTDVSGSAPIIDVRELERFEAEGNPAAVAAYHRVCQAADRLTETLELQAGDLVILNNKRCLQRWALPSSSDGLHLRTALASRAALNWPDRTVQ